MKKWLKSRAAALRQDAKGWKKDKEVSSAFAPAAEQLLNVNLFALSMAIKKKREEELAAEKSSKP